MDKIKPPATRKAKAKTTLKKSDKAKSEGAKSTLTKIAGITGKENHAELMLAWFATEGRSLPWRHVSARTGGGAHPDPYYVFLSEIMLQQTTVATVKPYFAKFIAKYPTVQALAAAPLDDVLAAWAGLGYYARARNMHKAARQLVELYHGKFPASEEKLRSLPGIGQYTAAAIAAIGFDQKSVVVDGNIERVISRIFAVTDDSKSPETKKKIYQLAAGLTPDTRPGDYAQAMMDLGASYCSPRQPLCGFCPVFRHCDAYALGNPESFPNKPAKTAKPVRYGVAYWLRRGDGTILLRRRVEKGLLGGMMELPTTPFHNDAQTGHDLGAARAAAPIISAKWRRLDGQITHIFTHFRLEMIILAAQVRLGDGNLGQWTNPDEFPNIALPSLFRKIALHALKQGY